MTEAEIIEMITKKRNELEENRSQSAGDDILKALEAEIEKLEASLPGDNTRPEEQQVFLDECAG